MIRSKRLPFSLIIACFSLSTCTLACSSRTVASASDGAEELGSTHQTLKVPVPGRPKLGVYRDGIFYLDADGNGTWDDAGDRTIDLGVRGKPFVVYGGPHIFDGVGVFAGGKWYTGGPPVFEWGSVLPQVYPVSSPFTIGTYDNGNWTFAAPSSGDGGTSTGLFGGRWDIPVVGDFGFVGERPLYSGVIAPAINGVFRSGTWLFDIYGEDAQPFTIHYGRNGDRPAIGDWVGDGKAHVGVFRNGEWIVDSNGNNVEDGGDAHFFFGIPGDTPIVGSWRES